MSLSQVQLTPDSLKSCFQCFLKKSCGLQRDFFATIFEGRTGSSFVTSNLNSRENILCYPEILAKQGGEKQRGILNPICKGLPTETLDQIQRQIKTFTNGASRIDDITCIVLRITDT